MGELRAKLKAETVLLHARLDKELISYDLTDQFGLAQYLSVHYLARSELADRFTKDDERRANQNKIDNIIDDLNVLGCNVPSLTSGMNRRIFHPLGLTYVIAGSSLGSKVLYKQWLSSSDEVVKQAGRFMMSAKDGMEWREFLRATDNLKITDSDTEQAVASANDVFKVYISANEQMKRSR